MVKRFAISMQVFVIMFFSLAGLMVVPVVTHACSCVEAASPQDELQKQTAVFSGKVLDVRRSNKLLNWSSADPVKVTFDVYRVWKGDIGKKVSLSTAMSGASCGFEFEEDQEYLVYANGDTADLKASLCSRTKSFLTAGEDIKALGSPVMSPIEDPVTDKRSALYYTLAVGSLVVVILSFIMVMRRRLRSGL